MPGGAVKKPTKGRRRRANERVRKAAQEFWNTQVGETPEYIRRGQSELGFNLDPLIEPDDEFARMTRAPSHRIVVDNVTGDWYWNETTTKKLTDAGNAGNGKNRADAIKELQGKYPELWDKRGKAKVIASIETEEGNPITERTIQTYFRQTRKK